jgi:hypothetical protein
LDQGCRPDGAAGGVLGGGDADVTDAAAFQIRRTADYRSSSNAAAWRAHQRAPGV